MRRNASSIYLEGRFSIFIAPNIDNDNGAGFLLSSSNSQGLTNWIPVLFNPYTIRRENTLTDGTINQCINNNNKYKEALTLMSKLSHYGKGAKR